MSSMERKWEECFGDVPSVRMVASNGKEFDVRVCLKCDALVGMVGDEPGMDHVRFHEELHRGLHP